jgi:hypothetical protein
MWSICFNYWTQWVTCGICEVFQFFDYWTQCLSYLESFFKFFFQTLLFQYRQQNSETFGSNVLLSKGQKTVWPQDAQHFPTLFVSQKNSKSVIFVNGLKSWTVNKVFNVIFYEKNSGWLDISNRDQHCYADTYVCKMLYQLQYQLWT